jgi:hypothetical protein
MNKSDIIQEEFRKGKGVLRLVPNFVPRRFGKAGKRLRLHPDDYYALGTERGAIKERWFSSVIPAMNGELASEDEGLSYVSTSDKTKDNFLLKEAVEELGAKLIGDELMDKYGMWPMYSKFFDFKTPLFFHLHLDDEDAGRVNMLGKPESYYFPPQLNNYSGDFPATYFGFDPDTDISEVRERLVDYEKRDIRITELSRAYRIQLGTGWYTPPGVLHAPGSYLTYEPQWNSDVNSVYENVTSDEVYSRDFLTENCPEDKKDDVEYILNLMDWEKNIDPHYKKKYFRPPISCENINKNYSEKWISYGNDYVGAKELTIPAGETAVVKDDAAYGCIIIQGHGKFGVYNAEAATILRFGQESGDEYFVSEQSAKEGVKISNKSAWEPMVILKHFGPNNSEMPK